MWCAKQTTGMQRDLFGRLALNANIRKRRGAQFAEFRRALTDLK
jgi:hypothetical protein